MTVLESHPPDNRTSYISVIPHPSLSQTPRLPIIRNFPHHHRLAVCVPSAGTFRSHWTPCPHSCVQDGGHPGTGAFAPENSGKKVFFRQISCTILPFFSFFTIPGLKRHQSRDSGLRKWAGIPERDLIGIHTPVYSPTPKATRSEFTWVRIRNARRV